MLVSSCPDQMKCRVPHARTHVDGASMVRSNTGKVGGRYGMPQLSKIAGMLGVNRVGTQMRMQIGSTMISLSLSRQLPQSGGAKGPPPPRTLLAVGTLPRGEFSYDALLSSPAASFLSRLSASTSPATTVLRSIGHREHRPCGSGIKMPQRLARHAYVRIMDENDHKPQA